MRPGLLVTFTERQRQVKQVHPYDVIFASLVTSNTRPR